MIVHKTFNEQTTGLTGRAARDNWEKLRGKTEEFITNKISETKAEISRSSPKHEALASS